MIFLFTEIDHPVLFKEKGSPEADHILSCQFFLIEEILFANGVNWMKRSPTGVYSAFESGDPAKVAILIQKAFQEHVWKGFEKSRVKVVLHAGDAEKFGQSYVGPEVTHTRKLLEAAQGGQILLTPPAVHFVPLPPGARLVDLGIHFLKDLSEPQNVYALQHQDLSQEELPPLRSLLNFPQNLSPQNSPFYGREEEIVEITQLLSGSATRLVTLIGPGGFGKTRLALQSAAELADKFKDGVYVVSLAPLLSDQLIVGGIANAIKFYFYGSDDPQVQLMNHLREKEMLLVMDNFEHIIEGAQLVEAMISNAPGLKILVTTREGLRINGEKIIEVRGLRYPQSGQTQEMEASSAVQLFLKSAHKIRPDFSLKPEDREPLLRICRLLEGMPLGLELSATWVGTLSLGEIGEKIESSRDFLATSMPHLPPRHRSLRAVFEYSWILLNEAQKKALMGISVFKGGFQTEAAREVAGANAGLLNYLENKSLVRKRSDSRYEVHELLKYYAKEKLFDDPAEKEKVFDAHCGYFARLLKRSWLDLYGPHQRRVLEGLLEEMGNIREGWKRAVEKSMEKELEDSIDCLLAVYFTKGWLREGQEIFASAVESFRGYVSGLEKIKPGTKVLLSRLLSGWGLFETSLGRPKAGQGLFEEALSLLQEAKAPQLCGTPYSGLGQVLAAQGDYQGAKAYHEKSLRAYRQAKERQGITWALNVLGHIEVGLNHFEKAQLMIRKSLKYSEAFKDRRAMGYSYLTLGDALFETGKFKQIKDYYQKGLEAYLESGDRRGVAWAFMNLGRVAEITGDFNGARQMYRESLVICQDIGDRRGEARALVQLGNVCWATGEYPEALRSVEQGVRIYREVGDYRREAYGCDLIGNLRLAMGEDKEAEKFYLKAYSLVLKEGVNLQNVAWNFYHLGAVDLFRKNIPRAREKFNKALDCFKSLGDNLGQVAALTHLGEAACEKKEYSKSEKYFKEAVRLALEAGASPLLVDVMVGLAGLLKAQGEDQKAATYLLTALQQPTCRQQTKDRVVSLTIELKAKVSEEEAEGVLRWAKSTTIEKVAASWLANSRPSKGPQKRKKTPRQKRKSRAVRKKKRR